MSLKVAISNFCTVQDQSLNDNRSRVTVEKLGTFSRVGETEAQNSYLYKGNENTLEMSRIYTTRWLCNYKMENYPFDTQNCKMIFAPNEIKLETRSNIYSGPTELTQYFVR